MMHALVLVKNGDERLFIKGLLKQIPALFCHSDSEAFTHDLMQLESLDLVILDERIGDLAPLLDKIAVPNFAKQPIVVVLLKDRNVEEEGWNSESDRIDRYNELGVELVLYRPSGIEQLKNKITEGFEWAKKLPTWVQLARVGRSLVKAKEYERIQKSLSTLHEMRPDDLSISLLYVRSLLNSPNGNYAKAVEILAGLNVSQPDSVVREKLLLQAYEQLSNHTAAFEAGLRLLRFKFSADVFEKVMSLVDHGRQSPFSALSALLKTLHAAKTPASETARYRESILNALAARADEAAQISLCVEFLTQNPDLRANLFVTAATLLDKARATEDKTASPHKKTSPEITEVQNYLLDSNPLDWQLLNEYVDRCLAQNRLHKAERQLGKVRAASAPPWPIEYHVCKTKVALARHELNEALRFFDLSQAFPESPRKRELLKPLEFAIKAASARASERKAS